MDTRRCPVGNERYDCSEIGLPGADICFGNLRKGCLWTLSSCTGPHLAPRLLVVTQVYNYEQTRMMLQYCAFTQTEGAHEGGTKWPAFRPGRGAPSGSAFSSADGFPVLRRRGERQPRPQVAAGKTYRREPAGGAGGTGQTRPLLRKAVRPPHPLAGNAGIRRPDRSARAAAPPRRPLAAAAAGQNTADSALPETATIQAPNAAKQTHATAQTRRAAAGLHPAPAAGVRTEKRNVVVER